MKQDKYSFILNIGRAALLIGAALMIAYGISRGERSIIFQKAAHICFECIGLGK